MPELPEVETAVRSLNKTILGRKIKDVWSDWKKLVKKPSSFNEFKSLVKGRTILEIKRRGKNIIFRLSDNFYLVTHQKMTGHYLFGKWTFENGKWRSTDPQTALAEPINRFLHLIFRLDDGNMLALSDMRKFAKVILVREKDFRGLEELNSLGPDPLEENFTFAKFKEIIIRTKGRIKQVLMNQEILAGIGNIYSDEILWHSKINPLRQISTLKDKDLKILFLSMKKVLPKAIASKGDSVSDYRLISGEKGSYQNIQKVYGRTGKPCFRRDGGKIKRVKVGGRSAHFCPVCQK